MVGTTITTTSKTISKTPNPHISDRADMGIWCFLFSTNGIDEFPVHDRKAATPHRFTRLPPNKMISLLFFPIYSPIMSTISFTQLAEQFAKAAADAEELANLKIKYDYVKNLNNTLENERLEHNQCFNLQMERLLFIQQLEEKIDKLGGEVYEHKSTNKQLVKELDDVKEKNRWLVRELEDLKEKNQHEDLEDLKKTQYNLEDEIKDLKEKNRKLVAALIDQVGIKEPPTEKGR